MKAEEVTKLSLRKLDGLYDKVTRQIRQEALNGKSFTIYYIYHANDDVDYSQLVERLKDDRFGVKYEKVYDQRDGNFLIFTISWKPHIMDSDLVKVQKELDEDSVETFDEMIDDLYRMAEKHDRLSGRGGYDSELGRKYKLQATIERNIARRIERIWKRVRKEKPL